MVKSDKNKIVISGSNKDNVVINNKNGTLKIKMNLESSFSGEDTHVTLYYTTLNVIDVNEGAKVKSDDVITQYEINLKAQEGGRITVPVSIDYIHVKAVTGGDIQVTGRTKSQNISIVTGGIYDAKNVQAEKTDVALRAGGEAYVTATKQLDINIRAGGDVYVYGKPETVNENKALGGRIKYMN